MKPRHALNAVFFSAWTSLTCVQVIAYQALHPDAEAMKRHTRRWARVLARGWGVRVVGHGLERLRALAESGPTVLMANHQSHADVVALFVALPVMPVFLAKQELRKVPLFGPAMVRGGHVFVDRGKHDRAVSTIESAATHLRPGAPLLVFPEGTRGRRAEIAPFKKGGFHLAKKAPAPIIPIGIRGSRHVWAREARAAQPGTIEIHVGEPVSAHEVRDTPMDELVGRLRAEIGRLADLPLV